MFKNYLKTAFRNILRARAFSAINIIGLSVSLALSTMILLMLNGMLKTDNHHEDADKIYRVITTEVTQDEIRNLASTTAALAPTLRTNYPEVESLLRMRLSKSERIRLDLGFQKVVHLYADENFLEFFDFEVKYGDERDFFKEPSSVVLTESSSERLFGDQNPVGEVVRLDDNRSFIVVGVLKDLPRNKDTHLNFDLISPFSHIENLEINGEDQGLKDYANVWQNYVYLKLTPGTHLDDLAGKIASEFDQNYQSETAEYTFALQSLKSIRPGMWLYNQMGPNTPMESVYFIMSLIALLMFIACFNYTNLSIARALKRAQEVGIRKVLGAQRRQVINQFLIESVLIAFVALLVSLPIHDLIMVPFMQSMNPITSIPKITELNLMEVIQLVGFTFLTGFLAGIVPAIFLSSIKIVNVIKGMNSINLFSRIKLRKVLIVLQFMVSMVLVVSVVTSAEQYTFQRTVDYGFDHENIINLELQGVNDQLVKNGLIALPGVTSISSSSVIPGGKSFEFSVVEHSGTGEQVQVEVAYVDYGFLDTYNVKLSAGRNFSSDFGTDPTEAILISESTLPYLGFENARQAIGERLKRGEETLRVIGVIKDFTAISMEGDAPMMLKIGEDNHKFVSIRTQAGSAVSTIEALEDFWPQLESENPIQYSFFSETLDRLFKNLREQVRMFFFFAGIVIVIAILGLFGMAIYTSESRIKEVGIRKVMGGSVQQITVLLSKDFIKLIGIGIVLGTPIAWFFNDLLLEDYKYRIDLSPSIFLIGAGFMLLLGFLTIGSQTVKAAKSNPVETLRMD